MTATEELRRMLDERGVWWHGDIATYWRYADAVESLFADNALDVSLYAVSPEQAIEDTLGPAVPPQEPPVVPYDLLIDLLRDEWDIDVMWDGLRRFWYVGLTEEGVRKRDEREATLGRGTCEMEYVSDFMSWHCKACGQMDMAPRNPKPRYCKWCGAKVVDDGSVD